MPIYEYHCNKCGSEFEKLVKNQGEKVKCENCNSGKVERMLSVFSAHAKTSNPSCPVAGRCPSQGKRCPSGGSCPGSLSM